MADLPNRLRELRTAPRPGLPKGLSLAALAEKVGCGITVLSDLERGDRGLSYDWMRRLAEALETTPDQLLLAGDVSQALSPDEQALLAAFRRGNDGQRRQALAMIELLVPGEAKGTKAA